MFSVPLLFWLIVGACPGSFAKSSWKGDWTDGLLTLGAMLLPLGLAFLEILRLTRLFPLPSKTDLFEMRPECNLPAAILAVPLLIWIIRRLLGRVFPSSSLWGVERPGLEIVEAVLAFAPGGRMARQPCLVA